VALAFSLLSFLKVVEENRKMQQQFSTYKNQVQAQVAQMAKKVDAYDKFLATDGQLARFIVAANLLENHTVSLSDILVQAQSRDFSKVGMMRLFVSGSEDVWVQIKNSSGETVFAKNVPPGLSSELFYYFKTPQVAVSEKTFEISTNFQVSSGNYERTYLVFFSFGNTKMAQMDAKTISNPLQKYRIWIPSS